MSCSLCDKPISNEDVFFELNCGVHLGHAHHKTLSCVCLTSGSGGGGSSSAEQVARVSASAPELSQKHVRMLSRDASEPLVPKQRGPVGSFIGSLLFGVSQLVAASAPVEESSDPFVLLKARVPLDKVMVDKHAIGITELINDHGVNINDFFANGYTIGDMCDAFPTRMNPQTGLDVLCNLGMHEEHFRRLPQLSQIGIVRDRLGYTPADMVRRFGLQYKSPVTQGGWTLSELVSVGIDMPLIIEAGLVYRSQWEELKRTGTPSDLALFGVTPALVASLAADPVPQPGTVVQQQPLPPMTVQPVVMTPLMHQQQVITPQKAAQLIVGLPRLTQPLVPQQQQQQPPPQQIAEPPPPLHVAEPVVIPPQILAQAMKQQQSVMNRGPRLVPRKATPA